MSVKKQIWNKLKSKKGSALLLAMFFSLICIILGMVVLASGETANGRIINAAKAEQSYFIVESLFREFQHETSFEDVEDSSIKPMKLLLDTADFGDPEEAFHLGDEHRLATLQPFVATALYQAVTEERASDCTLEFTMGGQGDLADTYTAVVRMTMQPTDYSIYLDVTSITKETNGAEEDIGSPNLHTIAIQCRRVTPLAVDGDGNIMKAIFEYYPAKYVQNPAAEG